MLLYEENKYGFFQESPKRKPTKGSANNKSVQQRVKRSTAASKSMKDDSTDENESEDNEPLSKKAKPTPPTVYYNYKHDENDRIMIIRFTLHRTTK